MRALPAQSCSLLDGCLTHTQHRAFAWGFVIIFIGTVLAALGAASLAIRRDRAQQRSDRAQQRFDGEVQEKSGPPDVYARAKPYAAVVKAVLQMIVGVIAVSAVGWELLFTSTKDPITLILNGIGIGLAAAAAVELAYTLFTPGPDEALDPLMLALSATLLLKLAQLKDSVSMRGAIALLLLGLLLAALFATRLMLAERDDGDERPRVWWVPHRGTNAGKKS